MRIAEELFSDLFHGRDDAIGLNRGGVERPYAVTIADYAAHLRGERAIGIFPMLDDARVWFAAIDLDEPNFDLARRMQAYYLPEPTWLERSRSGNAHVWVFFDRPCPAWAARTVLRNCTEAFGRPEVEVFPKQDGLKPGMVGNYINLPLFGDERPILDGERTVQDTLARMYDSRHNPDAWVKRARMQGGKPPAERESTSEWGQQPVLHECAAHIIENRHTNPLRRGARHVVLFNVAKQLLNWRETTQAEAYLWLQELNEAAESPISETELRRLFNNAREGRWTSTGCDEPQMAPYVLPDCPIASG